MRPSILPATLLLSSLVALPTLHAQSPAGYQANPKFVSTMADAKKQAHERQYDFAIDSYKKACKIAEEKDTGCLTELYTLQMKTGSFKDAAVTAVSLEAIAPNQEEKSYAETKRGHALFHQAGDKNKTDLLTASDAAFKSAIADNPKNASAHYLDGQVLARLGQIDAARDQFKTCLTCVSPNDPSYLRAQHFAENPALSTHRMAPPFTVTALDGTKFNLDAMGGRVVLIDFWATWCGPCNEELPHMKKIAKEFAGQPLVIISVSWDSDAKSGGLHRQERDDLGPVPRRRPPSQQSLRHQRHPALLHHRLRRRPHCRDARRRLRRRGQAQKARRQSQSSLTSTCNSGWQLALRPRGAGRLANPRPHG